MREQGLNNKHRAAIYTQLWYQWLPGRVTTFLWLALNGGLFLGTWLKQIGHHGICELCEFGEHESTSHAQP
jgi:hypothetical protein